MINFYCGRSCWRYGKDLIRFLLFLCWREISPSTVLSALSQQKEAFLSLHISGLFASRLYAASDLISVYSKPPFNSSKRLLTRIKMAAYGTLHLAHLSRLFFFRQTPSRLEFYIFTPHRYRSDVSPSAVHYSATKPDRNKVLLSIM